MSDRKLFDAAGAGDEALVSQLIKQGAKVDWRGLKYNDTALHRAAIGGHPRVVTRLLDSWWSLEARDNLGITPLTKAGGPTLTLRILARRRHFMQHPDRANPEP